MSIWFAIPSARNNSEAQPRIDVWAQQGYRIALLRQGELLEGVDLQIPTDQYRGWAASVNFLAALILREDNEASWIVSGGDDYLPDLGHRAEDIAAECVEHFGGTYGVMQPIGDRWGDTPESRRAYGEDRGALIDRICGSPWMGRDWCRRAYKGHGPLCGEYFHNFADEELQNVALRENVLWRRKDLVQKHDHWMRGTPKPSFAEAIDVDLRQSHGVFRRRQALGFPGSEVLSIG